MFIAPDPFLKKNRVVVVVVVIVRGALAILKIATSPDVRAALTAHPKLKSLLREIDGLEGSAREEALHGALGVSRRELGGDGLEGIDAMRGLVEAIEAGVRSGSRVHQFGLDWA